MNPRKTGILRNVGCQSTEQARLLQNRNLQTRYEEKDSFLLDNYSSGHRVDTSMLDTSRRERRKSKGFVWTTVSTSPILIILTISS